MEKIENATVKTCPVAVTPNLKALSVACSKDLTRPSLTSVYKDRGVLVATDGFHLNFAKVAEDDPTSGYLDGRTGLVFPDWCLAIPEKTQHETALSLDKDAMRKLKALGNLAKLANRSVRITLEERKTTFEIVEDDLTARYEIVPDCCATITQFVVTINLQYFLEFVEAFKASERTKGQRGAIRVTLRTGETDRSPIMVEIEDHYSIIMPIIGS